MPSSASGQSFPIGCRSEVSSRRVNHPHPKGVVLDREVATLQMENSLALLQGARLLYCRISPHAVHKLASLLSPVSAAQSMRAANLNRMERFPQIIFEKVSNSGQSQHLRKTYGIGLAEGSSCYRNFPTMNERLDESILCACKSPSHMQDFAIQPPRRL